MTAGLQVFFGDESEKAGKIQIDESYVNFHLRKSGIIRPNNWSLFREIATSGSAGKVKYFNINVTGFVEPIIVVNPLGDYTTATTVTHRQDANGDKYFVLYIWHNYEANNNVEYYIFDNWKPPTENFGLELFGNDGTTVYHSSWYRMKVVGSYVSTVSPKIGDSYNVSIPTSARGFKKLAMMTINPRIAMLDLIKDPNSYAEVFRDAVYFKDSTTAAVYMIPFIASNGWWNPSTEFWNTSPLIILFIDVSNYPTNY